MLPRSESDQQMLLSAMYTSVYTNPHNLFFTALYMKQLLQCSSYTEAFYCLPGKRGRGNTFWGFGTWEVATDDVEVQFSVWLPALSFCWPLLCVSHVVFGCSTMHNLQQRLSVRFHNIRVESTPSWLMLLLSGNIFLRCECLVHSSRSRVSDLLADRVRNCVCQSQRSRYTGVSEVQLPLNAVEQPLSSISGH